LEGNRGRYAKEVGVTNPGSCRVSDIPLYTKFMLYLWANRIYNFNNPEKFVNPQMIITHKVITVPQF
jgi:hypothetical protein